MPGTAGTVMGLLFVCSLPLVAIAAAGCSGTGQGTSPTPVDPAALAAMSPAVCLAGATELVREMGRFVRETYAALGQARRERDEPTADCLQLKTVLMKGLLELANRSEMTLREAASDGAPAQARSEYLKVSLAHAKLKQLKLAAAACPSEVEIATPE